MIQSQNTKTIYDLVQNAGREHGERVFLRYEENDVVFDVTYREFAAQCNAIGAWAKEQDEKVGHKVKVGLLGSSSHPYLNVLLGVMGNGNVSVPLDIQMNVDTFADCLNRSDVDILFYDWDHHVLVEGVKEKCPHIKEYISFQHGRHVPCWDNLMKEYKGRTVQSKAAPEDLAMILFTSGTTGRGKGVMLSNGNLIDNTFCTTDTDHPEREVYLNVLPIHHVFCINGDVLIVLRYGGTLCLNRDMAKLAAHIQLFQPSVIRMVPMIAKTLYNRIAIMARQTGQPAGKIRSQVLGKQLHKIISGGGYLAPDLAANYRNLGISIAQGYGMSECSPKISSPDWSRPDKVASVGRIVDGCQVRIVDGEIQVKSPSVMMGYYKEPDKTAEVMTSDGWLCTGDLGYVDEENFLYLTGRKKNLIILSNGENVAPEQLENLFEDDRVIEDILVFGENDTVTAEVYPNHKYIEVAGITDVEGVVGEIIKKHNETLPTFKRIMNFRIRETPFAKTSSKKIIRSQYFIQKQKEEEELKNVRQPENELQEKIYDCISAVLGHRRFGIDTDLYSAGLDSLGSVMLLTDLYNQAGVSITLKDLAKNSTVIKLEAFVKDAKNRKDVDFEVRKVYPLTNLQLYFAYVMRGNTTANLPFLFQLDETVDLGRLKKAIEDLFDLHPGLKGVVQLHEGTFHNFRHDDRRVEIPIVDLSEEQWEAEKKVLLKPYMYTENEPLYHVGIYRTGQSSYLFFDIAHIMGDGITMNVLLEDMNALYTGKPVEKENYTFFEYILDEKDRDGKGLRKENEAYFQKLMEGFKIEKSILNRKDSYDLTKGENAVLKGRFESLNRKNLIAFGRKYGVSENAMFLTAYNYCIGIFSNEKDTISTTIHSGRTDSRWARLAGPLFLTYYFRYTNVPHETVPELLKKSGRQIMDTMGCYISNLHADEMFFQYQGDILNVNQVGGAPAKRLPMQLDSLPFHLQVMWDEKGYFYELRYWKNRFDRTQLKIFLICLESVVEAMEEEPSVRRLRKHLPEPVFPKHYQITVGAVNREAGYELIRDVSRDTRVKAYVFNEECKKQPFGAWGNLYIMDYPTAGWVDQITNPYGPGVLYQTGRIARILPDGDMDFLENGGRTIMQEGITGRSFLELYRLEQVLTRYEGIEKASAYVRYGEGNKLILRAEIWGEKEPEKEKLMEYLKEKCHKALVPGEVVFMGESRLAKQKAI